MTRRVPQRRLRDWRSPFPRRKGWACVVRYGGIGDVLQVSSVFPALREAGYRVTVNVDDMGATLLRHDPHVDELLVQARGQVPNDELEGYWRRLGDAYDRLINLSGVIEGGLLAHPSREEYRWTWHQRHAAMNRNYLEALHAAAGIEAPFRPRFYPSANERRAAERERRKNGDAPAVLISLSGSSVHKAYPHWDAVIARLLERTSATVYLVGDALCQVLECGWESTPRVRCRSGRWSIRRVLAFAEAADVVVGTETGVLNAVGMAAVPKVVLLSHSSPENLTKHWRATRSVVPYRARCHPCHKLHYHSSTCQRDPGGGRGAWCAHAIEPSEVVGAIEQSLHGSAEEASAA